MPLNLDPAVGLCSRCRYARLVPTPRTHYWLCALSASDSDFERYPRLPVMRCEGHEVGDPVPFGGPPPA